MHNRKSIFTVSLLVFVLSFANSIAYGQSPGTYTAANQPPITDTLKLVVDGAETSSDNMPVYLAAGRAIIPLISLQEIIACQSEWGPEGELVIIGEKNRLQLFPGKNEMLVDSSLRALDTAPFTSDDGILMVPLRSVCESLGYTVNYDPVTSSVLLNSPGFVPLPTPTPVPVEPAPPAVNFSTLPTWGNILSVNGLVDLWKGESVITGYFTRLVNSPAGRTNNIVLSSGKVNGTILKPGEVFSFNLIVGPRTAQTGYQNAKVFAGKKVVTGIGGGICQTSSTLYNLALEADMQVLERHPHSLKVVYAPPQRDATVSWGGADFKFRNNKDFPVKILCKVDNGFVFAVLVKANES